MGPRGSGLHYGRWDNTFPLYLAPINQNMSEFHYVSKFRPLYWHLLNLVCWWVGQFSLKISSTLSSLDPGPRTVSELKTSQAECQQRLAFATEKSALKTNARTIQESLL